MHDRAETLIVMGAVAPARVGAPLESPSFRVVMGFTDAELEAAGVTGSDVLQQAVNRLLFSKVNVVSVAAAPGLDGARPLDVLGGRRVHDRRRA